LSAIYEQIDIDQDEELPCPKERRIRHIIAIVVKWRRLSVLADD